MTLEKYQCDAAEARALTDEIKGAAERTYQLLLNAHEWKAWVALGYASWREYAQAEFGMSQSRAYQLLDTAMVVRSIEHAANVDSSTLVEISERDARDIKPHLPEVTAAIREAVAAVPLDDRPAVVAEVVRDIRTRVKPCPVPVPHDRRAGEVLPANPLAEARGEALREPAIVAGKGIERLEVVRKTFEAAGSVSEIVADLANEIGPIDRGQEWLRELDRAIPVLTDLAAALRRRHIRSAP